MGTRQAPLRMGLVLTALLTQTSESQQPPRMCAGNADALLDFTFSSCASHVSGADLVPAAQTTAGADYSSCCTCPKGWYMHESSSGAATRCRPCAAGTEPAANRTACTLCQGNTFSLGGEYF